MAIESASLVALTGDEPGIVMQAFAYHQMIAKFRGEHKRSNFQPFPTPGLHTELTTDSLGRHLCSNAHQREGVLTPDPDLDESRDLLWQRLANFCLECKIRRCEHADCLLTKDEMGRVAPHCDWVAFREWTLAVMSCQASFTSQQKISAAHMQMARAASGVSLILKSWADATNSGLRSFAQPRIGGQIIDMAGVCSLIYWMLSTQADLGIGPKDFGQWDRSLVPPAATLPAIAKAHAQLSHLRICRQRIWSIVNQSDRRDGDLPDLIAAIQPHALALAQRSHELCTPSKCQMAHMNTTRTKQMHKQHHPGAKCHDMTVPVERVPAAVDLGHRTAWDTAGRQLCGANDDYIAISHVWSDGTGAGGKRPGTVNKCLFDFFRDLAVHYDCKAFWWDVICVPFERKARDRALGMMHTNYRDAKCTVVHDNYLLNFPWCEDGSPCLALVLSPWFSRGWTALELAVARKVQILFGDGRGGWVYKDLDDEILAKSPGTSSRAHWLASALIRRVRRPVENIGDLIAILRPRSTAYTRDRTGIAALLATVPDCDLSRRESEITERILQHVGRIPYGCLLHGASTIRDSGGFSWAPATLDEMPMEFSADLQVDATAKAQRQLQITEKGAVEGLWWYRAVIDEDIETNRIVPLGDNLESIVKVNSALADWNKCVLLRFKQNMRTAVLATTVKRDAGDSGLNCRYIGAVRLRKQNDTSGAGDKEAQARWRWGQVTLGDDVERDLDFTSVHNSDVDSDTDGRPLGEQGTDDESDPHIEQVPPSKLQQVPASGEIAAIEDEQSKDAGKAGFSAGGVIDAIAGTLASNNEGRKESATGPPAGFFSVEKIRQRVKNIDRREQHLLVAIGTKDENAMRYLIRNGVQLESGVVQDLVVEIETMDRSIYETLLVLGQVYRQNKAWEKAEDILELVINKFEQLKEDDFRYQKFSNIAKSALGSVLEARKQLEEAIELYQQVMDSYDNDVIEFLDDLMDALPELEDDLVDAAEGNAIDYYMPFISSLTNSSWNDEIKLKTITDLTVLYADQGRLTEAKTVFTKAIETVGSGIHVPCFALEWTDKYRQSFVWRQKMYAHHERTYKRALWQFKRILGDHHPLVILTAWNLNLIPSRIQQEPADVKLGYEQVIKRLSDLATPPQNVIRYARYFYGEFLVAQNRIQAAQNQFGLVLSGFPDGLGEAENFRFAALMQQGTCLLYQKNYQDSLTLFGPALDGFRQSTADEEPVSLLKSTTCQSQAWVKFRLACSEEEKMEAINLCQDILDYQEALWENSRSLHHTDYPPQEIPPSHEGIAETKLCLGIIYTLRGEFVKARELLGEALDIFHQTVGNTDIRTLTTAYRLGLACKTQGLKETDREAGVNLLTLATKYLESVTKGSFKVLGPFHTPTLKPAMALGQIYMSLPGFHTVPESFNDVRQHLGKAQKYFETALERFETTHAPDYPVTFELEQALGNVLRMQGMLGEAEGKLRYAIVNFHHSGETYKISEAHALCDLGHVYLDLEKWDKAGESYEKALKIFQDHADDSLATMQRVYLGEVRRRQRDIGESRRLLQTAYNSFQARGLITEGPEFHDHDACAAALHLWQLESEYSQNTEGAYSGLQKLANEPRATEITRLDAAAWLGDMHRRKDDHETARRWLEQAFKGYRTYLYQDHSSTSRVRGQLAQIYHAMRLNGHLKSLLRYNLVMSD